MDRIWTKLKEWFGKDRMPRAAVTALVISIIVVLNVIAYTLTASLGLYYYADDTKDVTVSDAPAAAFAEAIAEQCTLKVVFCQSREDVEASTTGRYVLKTAEQMKEKLPSTFYSVEFQNIIVNPNLLADVYGFTEEETKNAQIGRASVIFIGEDYVGNKQYRVLTDTSTSAGYVDFYDYDSSSSSLNAYIGEEVITAMGLWVLNDKHQRALVTTYHGETVTKSLSVALAEAGYTVETVDLRQNVDFSDVGLLIISNPQTDFEQAAGNADVSITSEIKRVREYLENGGVVYLALDPYSQAEMPVLHALMAEYGITQQTYETEDNRTVLQIVKDRDNAITTDGFSIVGNYAETDEKAAKIAEKVKAFNDGSVLMANASVLSLSGNAESLLNASSFAVAEADGKTVDRAGEYPLVAYAETEGGSKTGRLIVCGSIYLTASDAMTSDSYANRDFFFAMFEVLGNKEGGMPYGCKPLMVTDTVLNNLTMKTARIMTAALMMIPAALGVLGCVVLVRRKNR